MLNYISEIITKFKSKTLNAQGIEGDLYRYLQDGNVSAALSLFQNREEEVDNAIKEYNPQTHKVMYRRNKPRKNDRPYITEKLPRNRQKYINEVELFFLFGSPLRWTKLDGDDNAYKLFLDFIRDSRFDAKMRQIKRLAGAETECAKLYHLYNENGKIGVKTVVLARSTGYDIRPLFNQYGDLVSFAYGYKTKGADNKTVQHWEIETKDDIFECTQGEMEWTVTSRPNPTKRINVIYYRQPKAWDGVEPRLEREEMLDSKMGDTNNYFADPVAKASADVIQSLASPETTGKLIQLNGSNSVFDYVNPPMSSETRRAEQENLEKSILFDTFTPDFSFENMRGFGSVSGAAIKNAMILGFLKADNRKEIYSELIDRDKNLIKAILGYQHPELEKAFEELQIQFDYTEPFAEDNQNEKSFVLQAYSAGLVTLETAVQLLALTKTPETEIQAIKDAAAQKQAQELATKAQPTAQSQTKE
jgi:hypothetical protein